MPTRAVVAILATVVGVVLLASFKTPASTQPLGLRAPATPVTTAQPSPSEGGATSATNGAGGSPSPGPTPSPTPAGSGLKDGTYTGQDIQTEFGDNQVQVIISRGRIIDVKPLQLPYDRQRSAYISQVAGPMLHDEVIQAQSAQIDTISGATFTSEAYAQSVQSALDQAHA